MDVIVAIVIFVWNQLQLSLTSWKTEILEIKYQIVLNRLI